MIENPQPHVILDSLILGVLRENWDELVGALQIETKLDANHTFEALSSHP